MRDKAQLSRFCKIGRRRDASVLVGGPSFLRGFRREEVALAWTAGIAAPQRDPFRHACLELFQLLTSSGTPG